MAILRAAFRQRECDHLTPRRVAKPEVAGNKSMECCFLFADSQDDAIPQFAIDQQHQQPSPNTRDAIMLTCPAALATAATAALVFNSVDAHGYVSKPAAQFVDPSRATYYAKTITAAVNIAFGGLKWDDSPEANTATFTSSFPNAGYSSLRNMLDQQVSDCANTRTDVSPVDVSGLSVMNWQNDQEQKGFIDSHHGPCEVWIDDTMVDHQDDCVATYGSGYPANVNVDFSKCSGDCTLRFYWLALHEPNWQVYKQCVPIVNNSGGTQVQGTVTLAGESGCQNRVLRSTDDAPTHLVNGAKINWTDNRFLRAFNEFAAGFQTNEASS